MSGQHIKRLFSILLLLVFFYSTTPRDFLHLLANHKDTTDLLLHNEIAQLSGEHTHCGFLHLLIAPYIAADITHTGNITCLYGHYIMPATPAAHNIFNLTSSLRGPPSSNS